MAANPFRRAPSGRLRGADLVRSPLGSAAAPAIANGFFDTAPTPNRVEVSWLELSESPPITESWAGTGGNVDGKIPTTGGGTWVVAGSATNYGGGYASSTGGNSVVLHSAAYTHATFSSSEIVPGLVGSSIDAPLSLIGRATALSADTCYRAVFSVAGTPSVTLYKVIAGVWTQLASVDLYTGNLSASLSIVGSTITVSVSSTAVITVNDTSITAAGYWGFANSYGESGEDIGNSSIGPVSLVQQAAPSGANGTLTATETGSDTLAGTGAVLVSGSLDASETGVDTFAASGGSVSSGALSATETGADTFAASGVIPATGALTATEAGADSAAASGVVLVRGSLSGAETGDDTFAASGAGVSTGALSATETGSDTLSATGVVVVSGALSATELADAFEASGSVLVSGTMAASETGSDTFASEAEPTPTDVPLGGTLSAPRGGGPDAQVSMADWLKRFGRVDLPPETLEAVEVNDDEEAIALLLCALME